MSEIEAFFGDIIRDLRARGYSHSTRSELHVKLLDQTTALASAVFVRHKTDGSELETIGATYILFKTEGEWKIAVVKGIHPPTSFERTDRPGGEGMTVFAMSHRLEARPIHFMLQ